MSAKPERWINLALVKGLDVNADGTGQIWWQANPTPAQLSAAETAAVLAAIRGKHRAYR